MPAGGYFGQVLVVDAASGTSAALPLPDKILRAYIGGSGLGARLLYQPGTPGAHAWMPQPRRRSCSPRSSARR
jgi:aldehyde:ferredoxin oxidoreductase